MCSILLVLIVAQPEQRPFTSPASEAPEYGYALSPAEAVAGWMALFDGKTRTGWSGAEVERRSLAGGMTTSVFGGCTLKGEAERAGEIAVGDLVFSVPAGKFERSIEVKKAGPVRLIAGLSVRSLLL